MALIRNQAPQNPQNGGEMPPQEQPKQPKTLRERMWWREKWIVVICVLEFIVGVLDTIFGNENFTNVVQVTIFSFVVFSLINIFVISWLQNTWYRSKQAGENFWNQRF